MVAINSLLVSIMFNYYNNNLYMYYGHCATSCLYKRQRLNTTIPAPTSLALTN